MNNDSTTRDYWLGPVLLLWVVFFIAGLFPDELFYALRVSGDVVTIRAAINSPWVVSWAWTAYTAWHLHRRCRLARLPLPTTQAITLQGSITGLFAYLPMELSGLFEMVHNPVPALRMLYYVAASLKFAAWLLLLGLVLADQIWGAAVLRRLPVLFPSAQRP